jgi:tetratricopeptide (TPR) repeat protein
VLGTLHAKGLPGNDQLDAALYNVGVFLLRDCYYSEAERTFNRLLEFTQNPIEIKNRLVNVYRGQGKFEKAKASLNDLLVELDEDYLRCIRIQQLESLYKAEEQYDEAKAIYETLLASSVLNDDRRLEVKNTLATAGYEARIEDSSERRTRLYIVACRLYMTSFCPLCGPQHPETMLMWNSAFECGEFRWQRS